MKIVQAVSWYFPNSLGGTEVYVATLCSILMARGHECVVAVPTAGAGSHTESVVDGIRVLRYATPSGPTRAQALERVDTDGADMFLEWVRRERPDVVHFHTLTTGLGVREVRAVHDMGIRTVFTSHSTSLGYICARGTLLEFGTTVCSGIRTERECTACMLQLRGIPRPISKALSLLPARSITDRASPVSAVLQARNVAALNRQRQANLMQSLDAFVALTQWAVDAILANGGDPARVHINRLGIRMPPPSTMRERPAVATDRPLRIGFLGRFATIKGVDVLARALVMLPRDLPIEVTLRGPAAGPAELRVMRDVRDILGNDERFSISGPVPLEDTYAFLAGLDLLCCPSLFAEGGPTVALESRAVGTPVIGSAFGGIAEIIRDGIDGALFLPGDSAALAALITEICNNRPRIDEWRSNLEPVRTMRDVADDYLNLYEYVCNHASA